MFAGVLHCLVGHQGCFILMDNSFGHIPTIEQDVANGGRSHQIIVPCSTVFLVRLHDIEPSQDIAAVRILKELLGSENTGGKPLTASQAIPENQ